MSINKNESESGINFTISDISKRDLQSIYNSLTVAHLPDKQFLARLINDIKIILNK